MNKLFKGRKVTIMGLGLHGGGVGVAKFFCLHGANVLVTDLKTEEQLKESIDKLKKFRIEFVLGRHREEDFVNADLILKNPDVPNSSPYLEIAKKHKVKIETDVSLFFELSKAFIIGVTGTKGKSTTSSLIYHLLKSKYPRTFLAGNIGVSPLELLPKIKKEDRVVLELSSFELEDLKKSPKIAVLTNILPDHLNRYKDMAEYISAKKIIFKNQGKEDFLVLNYDDRTVRTFSKKSKAKVHFYSLKEKTKNPGCYIREQNVYCEDRKSPTMNLGDFKLYGDHNISNLLAAITVAKIMKVSCDSIRKSIKSFKGVRSRQEFIREVNGSRYYNDTTATMPDAVVVAIDGFKNNFPDYKLILICGGQNKNLTYGKLAEKIKEKVDQMILLPGTASDKIKEELIKINSTVPISEVASMEVAVREAYNKAIGKNIVLLSPAAASFNLFKNEFDRGEQFEKFVNLLK